MQQTRKQGNKAAKYTETRGELMEDQATRSVGIELKRQLVKRLCHHRKLLFHSWFRFLLLLCLVLFLFCYSMSNNSVTWWDRMLFNRTSVLKIPPYRVHPKHGTKPQEPLETTESPTIQPQEPLETTESPTIQPQEPLETTESPTIQPQETLETTESPTIQPQETLETTESPTIQPHTATQYHQAYPRNYVFTMDNTEVCKTKTPFLVLMVPVRPNDVTGRDAIRQTWGKDNLVQGQVVVTLFVLGYCGGAGVKQMQMKLQQENLQHHDLIQSNFLDTYLNLTIKTMVIMDWLASRCPTAAYAMKVDSDMFLNIDNLVLMLQKQGIPTMNYLTGMLMWNRPVVRTKSSKWYVPEELYPEPTYPTYTLGMGYIFSNDLPQRFVEISKSIKPFNIEDAYIGMCMKKLGLAPTPPPDPSQFKAYNSQYNRCEFSKVITYILGSAEQLACYWTDLKKPGPPC